MTSLTPFQFISRCNFLLWIFNKWKKIRWLPSKTVFDDTIRSIVVWIHCGFRPFFYKIEYQTKSPIQQLSFTKKTQTKPMFVKRGLVCEPYYACFELKSNNSKPLYNRLTNQPIFSKRRLVWCRLNLHKKFHIWKWQDHP